MEFWEAKEIESENFKNVARLHPRLFETRSFIDDADFLEKYGIFLEKKKKFPLGYLKLWPQDFIVEEITLDGEWTTVFPDKFLDKKRNFLPEDPVLYATLVKCGLSTFEVVNELAKRLGIEPLNIKFAGVKDKHAITSQLISIKGGDIEKINQISASYFFLKNLFSGEKELFLGSLKANQFTILIRTSPDFKKEEFLKRSKEIEKNGFYNFFYLQRFGIPRLVAPYCGLHILKGNYEEAVKTAFCKTGGRETVYFTALREEIKKLWGNWENIKEVLENFPLTFRNELRMVNYLIKNPTDFVGALKEVPDQTWLWVDSFASLLFNKLLSFYIRKEKNPPKTIPILSFNKKSWALYKDLLNQLEIFSLTFVLKNLKPFPFVLRKGGASRKTIQKIKILNQKIIPEGVILNFILPKGCYATTFLSHLFNLVSGALPQKFSNLPIDTKANLNQPSLEEILNRFIDVVSSPSWRYLWRIY
jgi:TruD family tRNA pseudouridine synthase